MLIWLPLLAALVQPVTCSWQIWHFNTIKVQTSHVKEIEAAELVTTEMECLWRAERCSQCHGFDMKLLSEQKMCRLTAITQEFLESKFAPFTAISDQMSSDDEYHAICEY